MKNNFLVALIATLGFSGIAYGAFSDPYLPVQGGTGTSTAPTYGQVLVGNAGGTYTLTATSSLGITGTGGSGTFAWTPQSDGNATSTELIFKGGFLSTASSTINSTFHLPTLSDGLLNVYGGLVGSNATSTWTFASSTLLADGNTFSGNNTFSNTITGSVSGNAGTVTNGVYTTDAGTVFLAPNGSAASLTDFPTLNQNTSGTAASLSAILANTLGGTGKDSSTFTGLAGISSGSWYAIATSSVNMNITGLAGTATALAGNGANCDAGNSPLGVDASGAVESCFDVWTEAENTAAGYTSNTGTVTSIATTWPVTGGTITTTGTLGWGGLATTSNPTAGNIFYSNGTNGLIPIATSSINVGTASALLANGANCAAGSYPLGVDASGNVEDCTAAGGSSTFSWTPTTYSGVAVNATSTPLWLKATSPFSLIASSTYSTFASTTMLTVDDGLAGDASAQYGATAHEWTVGYDATDYSFAIASSTVLGTNNVLTILKGGNVGIGTTSPLSLFSVGTAGNAFRVDSTGTVKEGIWNGTAIANANLANSTISGIALGSNLADLTATNASLTFSGTYTGATARTIGLNLANANTWTALQSFANASSTQMSIDATGRLYIPSGTNPTIAATGDLAINTTAASSSLRYFDGTAERSLYPIQYKSFTIASSTWLADSGATASSTIPLGVASVHGETWTEITCYTDSAGTAGAEAGDGTNWMDYQSLTTTATTDSSLSNNTFTRYEKRYVRVGQTATNPDYITCSVGIREESD